MYKIHNFDNWQEDSDRGKFGSGASEKNMVNGTINK